MVLRPLVGFGFPSGSEAFGPSRLVEKEAVRWKARSPGGGIEPKLMMDSAMPRAAIRRGTRRGCRRLYRIGVRRRRLAPCSNPNLVARGPRPLHADPEATPERQGDDAYPSFRVC